MITAGTKIKSLEGRLSTVVITKIEKRQKSGKYQYFAIYGKNEGGSIEDFVGTFTEQAIKKGTMRGYKVIGK